MYQVSILDDAEHDLEQLDRPISKRVAKRIRWLAENLDHIQPDPLSGQWARFFKLRVGDYRVIYKIALEEQLITVYRIRHRREVYREK